MMYLEQLRLDIETYLKVSKDEVKEETITREEYKAQIDILWSFYLAVENYHNN